MATSLWIITGVMFIAPVIGLFIGALLVFIFNVKFKRSQGGHEE
ncbi:hypothetical protein [Cognaticolwellia beringensis]|nr:hypothetical protein [Cognaticolwellia beringensis]